MTLEEALNTAAERGLTHLTLFPVISGGGKLVCWAARATPSTGHQYVAAEAQEPVQALLDVLALLPKAPKRVTATVKTEAVPEPSDMSDLSRLPADLYDQWMPKP